MFLLSSYERCQKELFASGAAYDQSEFETVKYAAMIRYETKNGNMNEKPDNGLYMVRMKGENVQKSSLVKTTL